MIGLDTTAIIDIFKGSEEINKFFETNGEQIALTILNKLEIYFGLDLSNVKHQEEERYYDNFFNSFIMLNISTQSCREASNIFWDLKNKGKIIEEIDCAIAAIYLTNGINKILTRNPKHFERIKKLNVLSY